VVLYFTELSGVGKFGSNDLNTSGTIQIPNVTENSIIQLYLEVPQQFRMIGLLLGEPSSSTVTVIDDNCMLVLLLTTFIVSTIFYRCSC